MKSSLHISLVFCIGLFALLLSHGCTQRSPTTHGARALPTAPPPMQHAPASAGLGAPKDSPESDRNPWSDAARDVLTHHCGSCHRGDLTTAVPAALAAFDLLEDRWYGRLTPKQLDGVLLRVRGTKAMDPADAATVEQFVRCARDGACEQASVLGMNNLR